MYNDIDDKLFNSGGGSDAALYDSIMAGNENYLVCGSAGTGKSVVLNGIIRNILNDPNNIIMLADPKQVEFRCYNTRKLRKTVLLEYADTVNDIINMLSWACDIMRDRYAYMKKRGLRKYDGRPIWIIIDEIADLSLSARGKEFQKLLQELLQLCRAANIRVVCATQIIRAGVVGTAVQVNFTGRVALKVNTKQDSRFILGETGAELLPRYGKAILLNAQGMRKYSVKMYSDSELMEGVE